MNKKLKILNDPVYGFINMPQDFNYNIIEHKWFQRLRHIRQLGLAFLVYPGAVHTRFQHVLGAHHLTSIAIETIKNKGFVISDFEKNAVCTAILLHDIGHGPFSHALENVLISNINHETITEIFFEELNKQYNGNLKLALDIFKNKYKKKYLHQLISGQLDMDRLDYLKRDSFFTGVSEGVIGSDRLINMLNVVNDNLVIEEKGIYSVEKFLIARRLMYWQVYLHKTVLAAEQMLVNIVTRVKELLLNGYKIQLPTALEVFLKNEYNIKQIKSNDELINLFSKLDDNDMFCYIKLWAETKDKVLSELCSRFITRRIYKIELSKNKFDSSKIENFKKIISKKFKISEKEARYFVITEYAKNNAYSPYDDKINILFKNGEIKDVTEASDLLNLKTLSKNVIKYFFCYPEECRE